MSTINRMNIGQHLLDKELQMIGKTREDLINDDRWRFNFTISYDQLNEFKKYSLYSLQKVFKFNKKKAEDCFDWWWKIFGVRIKN